MKKIFSITLAIYFLATSVGFGVNTHFCDGEAVKSALQLTQYELSCGMKMEATSCATSASSITKKSCCENEFNTFQVEDDFQPVATQVDFNPVFVISFLLSFHFPEFSVENETFFLDYCPPLVQRDFTILHESFLI